MLTAAINDAIALLKDVQAKADNADVNILAYTTGGSSTGTILVSLGYDDPKEMVESMTSHADDVSAAARKSGAKDSPFETTEVSNWTLL
jgi:hypothetical protein